MVITPKLTQISAVRCFFKRDIIVSYHTHQSFVVGATYCTTDFRWTAWLMKAYCLVSCVLGRAVCCVVSVQGEGGGSGDGKPSGAGGRARRDERFQSH